MQLAKSTMLKWRVGSKNFLAFLTILSAGTASAQNSPYSRYGLGDITPSNNIVSRGMGGITAGYADWYSINFNNPASYSNFSVQQSTRTKKVDAGRVILDAGANIESRTLIAPNTPNNFDASEAYFSYFQVGIPLKKKWGLSFGVRPMTRIGYKIEKKGPLYDATTNNFIDSNGVTQFNGSGGSFLPYVGTGFAIGDLSLGVNVGYLFGNREAGTRLFIPNDTVTYQPSEHLSRYYFGSIFYNFGAQYRINLKGAKYIRLGVSANVSQTLKGTKDFTVQTFVLNDAGEAVQIDSVFQRTNTRGEVTYPSSFTAGFTTGDEEKGWMFGADFTQTKWSQYRFFGVKDSVQDSWKLSVGGQFRPKPGRGYFSNVIYRAGFNIGTDYIKVDKDLPTLGASFGIALPIRTNRMAPYQINAVNLAFEFTKRGNNESLLKENMFRLSVGFNFTDLWFVKRKYE